MLPSIATLRSSPARRDALSALTAPFIDAMIASLASGIVAIVACMLSRAICSAQVTEISASWLSTKTKIDLNV